MFAMTSTRPDIAHAVGIVARYMDCPTPTDLQAAQRVLGYLNTTKEMGLIFRRPGIDSPHGFDAFSDSDYAGDKDTRRSTSGFLIRHNGNIIVWSSRRQRCVSLSTCEAELYALSECTREISALRSLLCDILMPDQAQQMIPDSQPPTPIYVDNTAAVALVHGDAHVLRERSRHVAVRCSFVREQITATRVNVQHIRSREMLADILTKVLGRVEFQRQAGRLVNIA
jgi:hypothetical protein